MTLSKFIAFCAERQGMNATQAVALAADVTGAAVRTVWHWVDIGRCPVYASRLLRIWAECPPEIRERWFPK